MIKGKQIDLRTIRDSELSHIFELLSDISSRGMYWNLALTSEISYKKKYKETGFWNNDFGTMVYTDKDGTLLGELNYFKSTRYESSYKIDYRVYKEDDRGKGYTTEALKLFTEYLFRLMPINRLEIQFLKGDIASQRVAEKCCFSFEGIKRQAAYSRGKYHDVLLYSLLRAEVL